MWVASGWWHAFPEISKEYTHSMWKQNHCWMKTWMLRKAAWGVEKGLGGGIGCQEDRQPKCRLKLCCERLLFQLTCTNQSFPIMHIMQENPVFTCFCYYWTDIPASCIKLLCCTELGTRAGRAKNARCICSSNFVVVEKASLWLAISYKNY